MRTLVLVLVILAFGLLLDIEAAPPISQPREKSTVHIRVYQAPVLHLKESE